MEEELLMGMPTPIEAASDPKFQGLPEDEQIKAMEMLDPRFKGLPDAEKPKAIQGLMQHVTSTMTPERTTGERFMRAPVIAVQGFNEGLANVLGLPVDLVTGAVNKAWSMVSPSDQPLIKKPFGGSESIKENLMPTNTIKPENATERMINRTGEEVGAATVPGGVVLKGAKAGVTAIRAIPSNPVQAIREVPSHIAEQISKMSPAEFTAIEGALATSAGAAAGVMKELYPNTPLAEWFGQILGSFSPAVAYDALKYARSAGSARIPAVTKSGQAKVIGENLKEIADNSETFRPNLEEAQALKEKIPGFKPTLGQATGDPAIISQQRAMAAKNPRKAVEQVSDANKAIRGEMKRMGNEAIGGNEGPQAVTQGLKNIQARRAQQIEQELSDARARAQSSSGAIDAKLQKEADTISQKIKASQEEAQHVINEIEPTVNKQDAGREIRGPLELQNKQLSEEARRRYSDVDPANVVTLDTSDIKKAMDAAISRQGKYEDVPEVVTKTVSDLRQRLPAKEFFNELRGLDSRLGKDIAADQAQGGSKVASSYLIPIRDAVKRTMNQLADPNGEVNLYHPDVAQKYRETTEWYAGELKRVRQGVAADVLQKGSKGDYDIPDSAVADAFFNKKSGAKEAAQQFKAAVGGNANAQEALLSTARENFLNAATDEHGNLVAKRAIQWMKSHREALSEFPELQQQFQRAANSQGSVDALIAQQEEAAKQAVRIRKNAQGRIDEELKASEKTIRERADVDLHAATLFLQQDPDVAMRKALNSKNPAEQLRQLHGQLQGDEAAQRGLKRALYDEIERQSLNTKPFSNTGELLLNPNYMREALDKHGKAITALFGDDMVSKLKDIQKAAEIVHRSATSPLGGSDTAEKLNGMMATKDWWGRLYGAEAKSPLPDFAKRFHDFVVEKYSDRQLRALMEEAFYNPDVAETLMRTARGAAPEVIAKRIHGHLVNLGLEQKDKKQ